MERIARRNQVGLLRTLSASLPFKSSARPPIQRPDRSPSPPHVADPGHPLPPLMEKECHEHRNVTNTRNRNTLRGRLSQHRGTSRGTPTIEVRSSACSLASRCPVRVASIHRPPGRRRDPGRAATRLGIDRASVKSIEVDLEARVSRYVGDMPFLWLDVGDERAPQANVD